MRNTTVRTLTTLTVLALIITTVLPLRAQTAPGGRYWTEDQDGDGIEELLFFDADGDGTPDRCQVDADGDGNNEQEWIDEDDDGVWDTLNENPDDDGDFDTAKIDTQKNGIFDRKWTDADGDGKKDKDEFDNMPLEGVPTGPVPQNTPTAPSPDCVTEPCGSPNQPYNSPGYLPAELYAFTPTSAGLADGYFTSLGPCGQLGGWTLTGGIAQVAISRGGMIETLPSIANPSYAFDVTSGNALVGMYAGPAGNLPFLLPDGGSMIALPTLGGDYGEAHAANDGLTHIVGRSTTAPGSYVFEATLWTVTNGPGGITATAAALPGISPNGGFARDVNSFGWVVGEVTGAGFESHAALWIGEPGNYELIDLGQGFATDVNDHGEVVGQLVLTDGTTRGFLYSGGTIRVLNSPFGWGTHNHRVTSINERGEMVGNVTDLGGATVPVYWPHGEGIPMRLSDGLDSPVDADAIVAPAAAESINDAGQIVVASYSGSEPGTYLLTPHGYENVDTNGDQVPDACQDLGVPFLRGDVNGDSAWNIADAVNLLGALFGSSGAPLCEDAADVNDDGALDISDPVSTLAYAFSGGPSPSATGGCEYDATADSLACEVSLNCSAGDLLLGFGDVVDEPCPDGYPVGVPHAYNECIGGTWHVVTDQTYACPDGTYVTVRVSSMDTGYVCDAPPAQTIP